MVRIYQSMEIDLSSLFYPILWQFSQLKKEILLKSQSRSKQTVYPSGSFQNDREWCCDHMSSLWHTFYLLWQNITAETLILIKCIKTLCISAFPFYYFVVLYVTVQCVLWCECSRCVCVCVFRFPCDVHLCWHLKRMLSILFYHSLSSYLEAGSL